MATAPEIPVAAAIGTARPRRGLRRALPIRPARLSLPGWRVDTSRRMSPAERAARRGAAGVHT